MAEVTRQVRKVYSANVKYDLSRGIWEHVLLWEI